MVSSIPRMGSLIKRGKDMNKYRVTSHVTIVIEKEIEATCRDEAIMKFGQMLDEEYGWADFDSVEIERR